MNMGRRPLRNITSPCEITPNPRKYLPRLRSSIERSVLRRKLDGKDRREILLAVVPTLAGSPSLDSCQHRRLGTTLLKKPQGIALPQPR